MTLSSGTRLGANHLVRRARLRRHLRRPSERTGGRLAQRASTARLMPSLRARSRGARLLPRLARETSRSATGCLGGRSVRSGPAPVESALDRMTLANGTRLGPYEILAPLGAGGMGEVYRARDERLEARRRGQGAARVLLAGRGPPAAVRAGGADGGRIEPPEHHGGLRPRDARRRAVHRHGAARGRDAARAARRRRAAGPQGDRLRDADRQGPRRGARKGDRPPGPEAREPLPDEGRPGQDPRLRPRQADAERIGQRARRRICRRPGRSRAS